MIKSKDPMLGSFREKINTSLLNFFKHRFVFLAVNTEIKAMPDKVFKTHTHTHTNHQRRETTVDLASQKPDPHIRVWFRLQGSKEIRVNYASIP